MFLNTRKIIWEDHWVNHSINSTLQPKVQNSHKVQLYAKLRDLIQKQKWENWEYSNHGRIARALTHLQGVHAKLPKELELLLQIAHGGLKSDEAHEELSRRMWVPWITWWWYNKLMAEIFHSTIFIYGSPGVWKTTVAQELWRITGLPVSDTDTQFEKRNWPIETYIPTNGVRRFREKEWEILDIYTPKWNETLWAVVSLGWGTLLRGENRRSVERCGIIITLTCSRVGELYKRIRNNTENIRPILWHTRPESWLQNLLHRREKHYNWFRIQIATDGKEPEAIAQEVRKMISIHLPHAL